MILDDVSKKIPAAAGLLQAVLAQVHAGVKLEGKVTFDGPGAFDPSVSVSCELRLEDGALRIKELHIKPAV